MGVVSTSLAEAEGSIDGQADVRGVFLLLAVVLPPANRAQSKRSRRFQRLISAAWAAKANLQRNLHGA